MSDFQFETPKPVSKPKGMTKDEVKNLFQSEKWNPTVPQVELINDLRKEFYKLAGLVVVNTEPSAEQAIAVRRIWEAYQYAKLAVMLNVEVF